MTALELKKSFKTRKSQYQNIYKSSEEIELFRAKNLNHKIEPLWSMLDRNLQTVDINQSSLHYIYTLY